MYVAGRNKIQAIGKRANIILVEYRDKVTRMGKGLVRGDLERAMQKRSECVWPTKIGMGRYVRGQLRCVKKSLRFSNGELAVVKAANSCLLGRISQAGEGSEIGVTAVEGTDEPK